MYRRVTTACIALAALAAGAVPAYAQSPAALSEAYTQAARRESPGFAGFSATRGEAFFRSTHGGEWSCASCHTANPAAAGRHARTAKTIAPLAPVANAERFTSAATAEKWFRRNCNDVLGRECTAQEKGDVLAYLMQVGAGGAR